ncbi:MAG: hypothetical protein RIS36_2267 [Pseudomonadota bacterium]|jgi:uncharacterized membrane protein (UPF0127 family)
MAYIGAIRSAGRFVRLLALVGCVAVCVVSACAQSSKLPVVKGRFVTAAGSETPTFRLEVCATDAERAMGLMYRRSLDRDAGMIFVFPDERQNSFWMKNTYIPLDMVFVGRDMKVVGILHDVPPLNQLPRSVDKPSVYVIEFAAGTMKRYGIGEGATLTLFDPLPSAR